MGLDFENLYGRNTIIGFTGVGPVTESSTFGEADDEDILVGRSPSRINTKISIYL